MTQLRMLCSCKPLKQIQGRISTPDLKHLNRLFRPILITPEVTALELVGYPRHGGGLSNVATILSELAEELSTAKLLEAARLCPVSWSQRLGHLLELVGQQALADILVPFVNENARSYTPLRRAAAISGGKRNRRWKLIVNVEVEPDE